MSIIQYALGIVGVFIAWRFKNEKVDLTREGEGTRLREPEIQPASFLSACQCGGEGRVCLQRETIVIDLSFEILEIPCQV